ncbi:MAG: NTP transferase domain-containing protein [Deltaproteobacteria bacterium]|nr:NTP transferase domain-containing protein [Deltaproteobacteria bacterium]
MSAQLVLICGGRGTRWPGRQPGVPKSMVELAGEPIVARLWRQLRALHTSSAPPIVVVAAGDVMVPAFVTETIPSAIVVTQSRPDGVANAVRLALPHLSGPALVVLGDIVLDGELSAPPPSPPAVVIWPEAPPAATVRNFGVRIDRDGAAAAVFEKPTDTTGLLCGLGLYWLTPEVIDRFGAAPVNPSTGEREITAALGFAMQTTRFGVWHFAGRYFNLNTAADFDEAERILQGT